MELAALQQAMQAVRALINQLFDLSGLDLFFQDTILFFSDTMRGTASHVFENRSRPAFQRGLKICLTTRKNPSALGVLWRAVRTNSGDAC